jgi:hypothetical protein
MLSYTLKLHTTNSCIISLCDRDFSFTLEEICLIAPKVVNFFLTKQGKFIFSTEKSNENDQLIHAMESIQSLFTNQIKVDNCQENEKYFSILADKFNHSA